MSEFDDHRRRRRMRPNAQLYIRHDVHRFMPPGSPLYVGEERVKYFFPEPEGNQAPVKQRCDPTARWPDTELLEYRRELAKLRFDWEMVKLKPRLGPAAIAAIAAEAAKRAIEAFRKDNLLENLFGGKVGTVTYTEFNGERIFGSNSTSSTYTSRDFEAANRLREVLGSKYPDVMNTHNIGGRPNDAVFHAESTALLRAAKSNGGTLAGRSLEIHSDRYLCWSCGEVLPRVGLELGDPTVTFVQPDGRRKTMRNGSWID
jgi:hypothetical protein